MQAVHSLSALDCLEAAEGRPDIGQVGQVLEVVVFFGDESADEVDAG